MEQETKKNKAKSGNKTSSTSHKTTKKQTASKKPISKSTKQKSSAKRVEQKKKIINKTNCLYFVFAALLILVIFLGIKVFTKSKEKEITEANIVVPVLKKDLSYDMSINLEELNKKEDYSIKISNFRQDNINQEEIEYKITIINDSKAQIKVTKDQDETNLIKDQESTRIEGVSLKSKEKDYAIYHFSIIGNEDKIKSNDKIEINIKS